MSSGGVSTMVISPTICNSPHNIITIDAMLCQHIPHTLCYDSAIFAGYPCEI